MRSISLPELISIGGTVLTVTSLIGFTVWRFTTGRNR
jgi:hypothetical protein